MRGERETEAGESFAIEPMQGSSVKDRWNTGPARTNATRRAGAEIADLS